MNADTLNQTPPETAAMPRGCARPDATQPLLSLKELRKDFIRGGGLGAKRHRVRAVRGVSLDAAAGGTLGIVGESGCGKSTLGRMAVGLLAPDSGEVFIQGRSLWDKSAHPDYAAFRKSLAGVVQMVFQDPYSSLNPRMRIGASIAEPLVCSFAWRLRSDGSVSKAGRADIDDRVARMLESVGLGPDAARRYPHEFSGGQRQRIAIARALVTRPAFVVCDEPTSSLDASVQAQVLNLLRDLQDELGLTYLFISHDLAVVRHMSDHVAVMYLGLVVESGPADELFAEPLHPYTRLLLDVSPGPVKAETGGAFAPSGPRGCPFAPRCPQVLPHCLSLLPELCAVEMAEPGQADRAVRCFLYGSE